MRIVIHLCRSVDLEQQLNAGEQLSRKLLEEVLQEALGEPVPVVAPLL